MRDHELLSLLHEVGSGNTPPQQALERLKAGPFKKTELDFATLDHHRALRHGIGEVVYGESKSVEQNVVIAGKLAESGRPVLLTRLNAEKIAVLQERFPEGRANKDGRTFIVNSPRAKGESSNEPWIAIVAAGTSDLFVAEEAAEVCVAMGVAFEKFYDIGVSGLQRLLDRVERLQKASALVVIAGMEGALPSVVAGLMKTPVFAVPTSVGYGVSLGGVTALLAMLNSCAPGVTVVNIDNGFSAAFAACNVINLLKEERRK